MHSSELTLAITTLANAIASSCRSNEEMALVAAILVQLGDTLSTIAVHRSLRADEK